MSDLLLLCVMNLAFLLGLSESQMPNLAASAPAVARCAVPAGAIMVPAPAGVRRARAPGPGPYQADLEVPSGSLRLTVPGT